MFGKFATTHIDASAFHQRSHNIEYSFISDDEVMKFFVVNSVDDSNCDWMEIGLLGIRDLHRGVWDLSI